MAVRDTLMTVHWVSLEVNDTADSGAWECATEDFPHGLGSWW